jgi:hypothetical protein
MPPMWTGSGCWAQTEAYGWWLPAIRKNKAERAAFRSAELSGFVLTPAYQKTPMHQVASFLLWRWPEMEQLFGLVGGAAVYELPLSRTSKIRQLPL